MPKRIIDGEALWTSDKLLGVPTKYRSEYANLIPLALANGVFECDPDKVWSRVYAYNRPDIVPSHVVTMLDSYESAKMLFRWQEPDGKLWGYWIGIDKIGRLPTAARLNKRHERIGPTPSQEKINQWLAESQPKTSPCAIEQKRPRIVECFDIGQRVTDEVLAAGFCFQGQKLQITDRQDAVLATAFPWVDRPAEYRKMDSWLVANAARHIKKFSQFAHNWFSKIPPRIVRQGNTAIRYGVRLY
jgi:hypothetical protein